MHNVYELLPVILLTGSIACVWSRHRHLWILPYSLFVVLGLQTGWIESAALLSLSFFALTIWFSTRSRGRVVTVVSNTLVVLVALIAAAHIAPGFNHILLLQDTRLSESTGWSALRFSADKPSIGIFLLVAHREALCRNIVELAHTLFQVLPVIITGCLLIYILAVIMGFSTIDITASMTVAVWMLRNLFFTVVAEEAFFRGFIQSRLQHAIRSAHAQTTVIAISAAAFGAVHLYGGWQYGLLATLAGGMYAYAFYRTGRLEAAIVAHIALNTGHVLLLSYP